MPLELTEAQLQEKIDAAVTQATSGLKTKNEELLRKIGKANEKAEAEAAAAANATEKAEQDRLTAEGKHEEVLERVRKGYDQQITDLTTRATTAEAKSAKDSASLRVLLVDNNINKQLVEAGVTDPILLEAAAAMIAPNAEIIDGEEGKEQTVQIAGKPIDEYFKGWKETTGKSFIANGNSGGGGGNENSGGSTDDWETHFKPESANQSKQRELELADPSKYAELRKKYPLMANTPLRPQGIQ